LISSAEKGTLGSMTNVVDMTMSGAEAPVRAWAGVPAWTAAVLTHTLRRSSAGFGS